MSAPAEILNLVDRFARNTADYQSAPYNEAQVRQEFVNPFFKALGWDIDNTEGNAEAYKDVIHEDAIKVGGATKAPDYCFRIGGTRKFFLEAKKPAVQIKDASDHAFQLRRYAWSAKLPLSILTNFAELAVYDCRQKPAQTDKASTGRTLYFTHEEYSARWDDIAAIISRAAVLKGSFDKYAEAAKGKRGTAAVDAAFLAEIESWRDMLAKNLASRNPDLSQHELNYAVQVTIDRIIFLRMCEDRGVERYGQLMALENGTAVYGRLRELLRKADDRYNSGLFHFQKEKDRPEQPDELTPGLQIDDKPLKDIVHSLYYPNSPYEFSVLPAEILGQVYEQFLGKVIRLTKGHQARVEDKPEVKKAGGVYYTPAYIVDYIVKHTVGKLVEGKTPKQVAKLRILDPACGSGSFLLGAYQYLLDCHRDGYVADGPEKHPKELYQGHGGWRLTTAEKKRILLNNIQGVDIDPQAVEVTKLSLLLKVLEGESQETLDRQRLIFHERALPDLAANIKCGNSLIGADFYNGRQLMMFDEEERYRINVFDWQEGFPAIMKAGGFDAVIGNPPYAYRKVTEDFLRTYYLDHYECAEGNFDLYKFFVERGLSQIQSNGYLGMIVSATFLVQPSFEKLRKLLSRSTVLDHLAPLGPKAFADATVDTSIVIARRGVPATNHRLRIQVPKVPTDLPSTSSYSVSQNRFSKNMSNVFDYRLTDEGAAFVRRLFTKFPSIESGYEFGVGINTRFIRDELVADRKVDRRYHPMVAGNGISRYGKCRTNRKWIMYDSDYIRSRGKLGRTLPSEHLLSSNKILVVRTRNLSLQRRIIATIDTSGAYNLNRLSNIVPRVGFSLPGLLGILNSALYNWLFSTRFYDYEIKPVYLRSSPLAPSNDKTLTTAVRNMLSLHQRLSEVKTSQERTVIKRQIDVTDHQIDRLVYRLYELTEREIKIVEAGTAPT